MKYAHIARQLKMASVVCTVFSASLFAQNEHNVEAFTCQDVFGSASSGTYTYLLGFNLKEKNILFSMFSTNEEDNGRLYFDDATIYIQKNLIKQNEKFPVKKKDQETYCVSNSPDPDVRFQIRWSKKKLPDIVVKGAGEANLSVFYGHSTSPFTGETGNLILFSSQGIFAGPTDQEVFLNHLRKQPDGYLDSVCRDAEQHFVSFDYEQCVKTLSGHLEPGAVENSMRPVNGSQH